MVQLQRIAIAPTQIHNQHLDLTAEQQHYLGRVLRLQAGDRFIAIDGQGLWWLAQLIVSLPGDSPQAQILEAISVQTELSVEVTLLVALPKTGFDDIVRCCTELGVSRFIPVLSERTLLKPSEQKLLRWRRIATEAAEQSERQIVPSIQEPLPWISALSVEQFSGSQYICVARRDAPHLLNCFTSRSITPAIQIATGPEGGWTTTEVEQALSSGFQAVSLGERVLRAVTAPITAVSIVSAALEISSIGCE